MMNKTINIFYKIVLTMLIILMGLISFSSVLNANISIPNIIIGVIVLISMLIGVYKLISKFSETDHYRIAYVIFIIVFSLMVIFGIKYRVIPTSDLSHVINQVDTMIKSNSHNFANNLYFSIYPQNIPLCLLLYRIELIAKSLMLANPSDLIIVYTSFMTALTILFAFFIIKKVSNSKVGLIGMILLSIYPDFYLNVSYYYTDITALPFMIIGIYILYRASTNTNKLSYVYYLLCGILFAIAFKLNMLALILFISLIIDNIIKRRNVIKYIILPIISFALSLVLYNKAIVPFFNINLNNDYKLPTSYYIMNGLNNETRGSYSDNDVLFALNNSKNEIKEEIKKRITKLDGSFYYDKLINTYVSNNDSILYKYNMMNSYGQAHNILNYQAQNIIIYLSHIIKTTIFVLLFISLINNFKNKEIKTNKLSLYFFSIFIFIFISMLFISNPRILIILLPLMLIGGLPSIELINTLLLKKTIKINKFNISIPKISKGIGISIIILIPIILTLYFFKLCINENNITENSLVQSAYTNDYIPLIDDELEEVFNVSNDFNTIEVYMDSSTINNDIKYNYEILDEEDNIIVKDTILIKNKEKFNNEANKIILKFKTIKVQKFKSFTFKISSNLSTNDNYLSLNTYSNTDDILNKTPEYLGNSYDVNPNGETYINNRYYNGSLTIKVMNKYKGIVVNKISYIIFSLIVIIISYLSIYYTLIKKI